MAVMAVVVVDMVCGEVLSKGSCKSTKYYTQTCIPNSDDVPAERRRGYVLMYARAADVGGSSWEIRYHVYVDVQRSTVCRLERQT
jgi:hypothetical protein